MPAKQHDFTATEIKAGLFVLASLIILIGFLVAIRGCRAGDEDTKVYFAVFTDIGGLNTGADVRFGGVRVGRVSTIEPDPEDRARIRVTAEVGAQIPVNHGSIATIEQITLTTEKHLEISTGDANEPLHESGDTLTSASGGGLFDVPALDGVVAKLETTLDSINALLGVDDGAGTGGDTEAVDLAELMSSLKTTLDEGAQVARSAGSVIEDNRADIDELLGGLGTLEATATELMAELKQVLSDNKGSLHGSLENIEQLTGQLNTRLDELLTTLQSTFGYLEDLSGNSSDLIDEQRPTLEETLLNLQETTRNLREFSRILADQPDALIRGREAQGRRNGETK
ncbi:MAG: MlaD family protein [Acidobacteria bacterium]|jgi:phospholipid/cholesterol/gamma-HCH transport system substrate-binding protein|nr:MlaD family protein [Acidobacteriota bacterium]